MANNTDKSLKARNQALKQGALYVVATPIGNMKDISFRAIEILKDVSLILCENTLNSQKLLSNFGIHTKTKKFTDFSDSRYIDSILDKLRNGENIALISDAGTPVISDPGYKLISAVHESGLDAFPIPGASSVTAIASISPIPMNRFHFYGFLPNTMQTLKNELSKIQSLEHSIVFFESPKRILKTLAAIKEVLGERRIFLARELSKLYEQNYYGKVSQVIDALMQKDVKGEIVFIMEGRAAESTEISEDALAILIANMIKNMSVKDAVSELSKEYNLPKKYVYNIALKIKL